jgi:glycosyltransferase involved in cell wall biosynthesis
MFSIVCVYNDETSLRTNLRSSLEKQTAKFELILLDNTNGSYKSAAQALNYGGKKARHKYIMFVHQDVRLNNFWLEKTENILDKLPNLGVAGCAGAREGNSCVGFIKSVNNLWGKPLVKPEVVQTLDTCILMVPKTVFDKIQFDEKTFDGWHCYGEDYCLATKENLGLYTYVIPAFMHHNSPGTNWDNLLKEQAKLCKKYRYKRIYTVLGTLDRFRLNLRLKFAPDTRGISKEMHILAKTFSWICDKFNL